MLSQPLKIAHYTNVYKPMKNGVVSSVDSFRRGQLDQGHSVYIVAPTPRDKNYVPEESVFNITAVTLPNQAYPFALPYDPTIIRVLREIKPDVLHTHHPVGLGRYAGHWSQRFSIPLVFTFHTWYEDFSHYFSRYLPFVSEEQVGSFIRFWIRKFVARCHQVVAPGKQTRTRLLEFYGDILSEDDVAVVPTGIDIALFSHYAKNEARASLNWAPEQRYLVSCGRLSREKNFELLIDSFARMEESAKLIILGDGDLRPDLEKQILRLGLQERVELPGNVCRSQVARYFSAADLFCFASPNETQGLVVLEAMAAGTPTVVVEGGGVMDFVRDDVNGLIAENNPNALCKTLDRALRSSGLDRLRQNAVHTAAQFSIENQTREMSKVYARAIQRQKENLDSNSEFARTRLRRFTLEMDFENATCA